MISRRGLLRGLLALPVVGVAAKFAGKQFKKVIHRFTFKAEVRVVSSVEQTDEDREAFQRCMAEPYVWSFTDPNTGEENVIEIDFGG